jgi:hypothetical protein
MGGDFHRHPSKHSARAVKQNRGRRGAQTGKGGLLGVAGVLQRGEKHAGSSITALPADAPIYEGEVAAAAAAASGQ